MPGRTFDMVFLSGIAGFFMIVCGAVFSGAMLGGMFDQSLQIENVSDTDLSARRVSPR